MHRKDDIMNYSAIFHRPMSEYAHAVDDTHYIFRLKTAANDIKECTFYYGDRAGMSPQITFYPVPMKKVRSDKYYDYFEVLLETEILRVAYYFELNDGNEKAYYLGDCFSKTDDVERYEHFQFPFNLKSDRIDTPKWVKDAVVYNIFPDNKSLFHINATAFFAYKLLRNGISQPLYKIIRNRNPRNLRNSISQFFSLIITSLN